jgi:hypothetical protein
MDITNPTPNLPKKDTLERQCPRHRVKLPFRLGGRDEQGEYFEEEVVTRDISQHGGSFASNRPIQVGATLRLADRFGFISMIRIAWGINDVSRSDFGMYGFRFLFPLEEWPFPA